MADDGTGAVARSIFSLPAARPEDFPDHPDAPVTRMPEFWLRPHVTPEIDDSPQSRDSAYVLRGRDHELAWMARHIRNLPRPVQLIQGVPGAGKTSLLHTIGYYAAAQNHRVIVLDHGAFRTHTTMARALDRIRHPGDRIPNTTTLHRDEATAVGGTGKIIRGRTGTRAATATTHDHDEATAWQGMILREAANPDHEGLIILLDEVQNLRRAPGDRSDDTEWGRIRSFLQWMHNAPVASGGRSRTMLICAGLNDSTQVLKEYGLTRVEGEDTLGLGPIPDDAVGQIIDDHMAARQPGFPEPLPALPGPARTELIRMAGGFGHHVSHAAQKAQAQAMLARREERTALSEDDVAAILSRTQAGKLAHYQDRTDFLDDDNTLLRAAKLAAQATRLWGTAAPKDDIIQLFRAFEKRNDLPPDTMLRELTRKGVLEARASKHPYPTAVTQPNEDQAPHYVLPILSMRAWLHQELLARDHDGRQQAENDELIRSVRGEIPEQERIPSWTWDPRQALGSLPKLPPSQRWGHAEMRQWQPAAEADPREIRHRIGETVAETAKIGAGVAQGFLQLARKHVRKGIERLRRLRFKHTRKPQGKE